MSELPMPRAWSDWDYLGAEEEGYVYMSAEDCPLASDAAEHAIKVASTFTGTVPTVEGEPTRKVRNVCLDVNHEQGDCERGAPCNGDHDMWVVRLIFSEGEK